MDEDMKPEPRERFRNILANRDDETNVRPLSETRPQSPLAQLPRRKPSAQPAPLPAAQVVAPAITQAPPPAAGVVSPYKGLKFGPAFWTVTGILSLAVNAVLIAVLVILLRMLGAVQLTAGDTGAGLVSGLYNNFEKMENAHIVATIPVVLNDVPVDFVLNYSTDTDVVLTRDVPLQANVEINSGGITINSVANIVLPKDTRLPVHLDLQIPVQTAVNIDRQLPVDIPIASTELRDHFQGLQDTIKPIYCLLEPNALDLTGNLVCR